MEDRQEKWLKYTYYARVIACDSRLIIKPDYSRDVPWEANYSAISLPLNCYVDNDIVVYPGQLVVVNAFWTMENATEFHEVVDAQNYVKKPHTLCR